MVKNGRTLDKIAVTAATVKYAVEEAAASPVKVVQSDLKVEATAGHLLFDRETGYVVEQSSTNRITGALTLDINGMQAPGKLDLTISSDTATKKG